VTNVLLHARCTCTLNVHPATKVFKSYSVLHQSKLAGIGSISANASVGVVSFNGKGGVTSFKGGGVDSKSAATPFEFSTLLLVVLASSEEGDERG